MKTYIKGYANPKRIQNWVQHKSNIIEIYSSIQPNLGLLALTIEIDSYTEIEYGPVLGNCFTVKRIERKQELTGPK